MRCWKRCSIRVKLTCGLLGLLLLTTSTLLALGVLFNRSMDRVDKRLQDYYNITAFSDAFTSADRELEAIARRVPEWSSRIESFETLRREADEYLAALTDSLSTRERERYLLINAISAGYQAYMEEADAMLEAPEDRDSDPRYYGMNAMISSHIRKYIPELLMLEIGSGKAMYAESRKQINALHLGGILLFSLLHAAAVFLLTFLLGKAFFSPVRQIIDAMRQIEAGDFDAPDISVQTEDEMERLVTMFNTMKHSTRELVTALREKNGLERELHIRAEEAAQIRWQLELARYAKLKSQVNPHFLFNTLNTIARVAREEGAADTERLIVSLARLFRYSLETDAPYVTLAREIKCVNDYMRIQDVRFGDRLRFSWRIDPRLNPETVFVVPYTLQPFVENAVIHGLRDTLSNGRLRITLRLCPEGLAAYIADNGSGIGREQLEQLRNPAQPSDDGHIGIDNVRRRLRYFRPKSRLTIGSWPAFGTCVKIVIPQEEGNA